jgi:hypothetical protein
MATRPKLEAVHYWIDLVYLDEFFVAGGTKINHAFTQKNCKLENETQKLDEKKPSVFMAVSANKGMLAFTISSDWPNGSIFNG